MITALVGLLSSTGFGTVIGMVGSWLTRYEERKNQQLKFEQDYKMSKLDLESQKLEQEHQIAMADKQMEVAEVEADITTAKGELDAFKTSLVTGNSKVGSWVDSFNSLMRPVITLFLLGVGTWFTYKLYMLVGGLAIMENEEIIDMFKHTVYTVMFLASTAVTWWFGARPTKNRLRGK